MALKTHLENYIRVNGEVSYQVIKDLVETGYFLKKFRMTTAERRLRDSTNVEPVKKNGAVIAYRWIGIKPEFKYQNVVDHDGQVLKTIKLEVK